MIVYLAQDIPAFVLYCINGESGSSLLIESTDFMIHIKRIYRNIDFWAETRKMFHLLLSNQCFATVASVKMET